MNVNKQPSPEIAAQPPTIKDVARHAGVSHMTVSRVMNGGAVAPKTRARVERACAELGYEPNRLARGLVNRASRLIGVVASDITNPFIADVVQAIHQGADEAGFVVAMMVTDYDVPRELRALDVLMELRVAGIIVTPPEKSAPDERLRMLANRGLPIVAVARDSVNLPVPNIRGDVRTGTLQATRHLLDLGHRRIAYIAGSERVGVGNGKVDAYRAALAAAGASIDECLIAGSDDSVRGGYLAMQIMLGREPRPTAVMGGTDRLAIGAMGAIGAAGLRIPDDISVVGFDDIGYAASVHPPLTTVHQSTHELGQLAARLLFDLIRARQSGAASPAATRTILPCSLVVRGSTGPAPDRRDLMPVGIGNMLEDHDRAI